MLPCTRTWKKTVLILCDKICEEQAFLHLLSTSNFGYNTPQDTHPHEKINRCLTDINRSLTDIFKI